MSPSPLGGGTGGGSAFLSPTDDHLYGSIRAAHASVRGFEQEPANGVELTFRGVSVAIKRNCIAETVFRQKSQVLVRSAIGRFPAGHLHAIVALSEESATALADVLSGRIAPVEGHVWADGLPARVAVYREAVGVVRLLSWTVEQFSVEENLHFAGAMRRVYPSAAKRQKRVEALAAVLCLDLQAKVRALSPAAKRRVDVAMELMASPPVLFVHNPLWGLDCHSRADFAVYLSRVAQTFGTTVIVTLPKLELSAFDLLHSLVILGAGGHTVFSGKRNALADYFIARVQNPLHQIPTPARVSQQRSAVTMSGESGATLNASGEVAPLMGPPDGDVALRANALDGLSPLPLRRRSNFSAVTGPTNDDDEGGEARDSRMPSFLSQRPATEVLETALSEQHHCPPSQPNYSASGSGDGTASGMDLDGGDCVMDHVQLWAALKATDRYAAAFFDSHEHQRLDRLIDEAVTQAHSSGSPPRWIAEPLQQPGSHTKFARLMYANVKQRAVTIDWYVGWCILSVAVTVCLWLAQVQSTSQEGMFNVRGIVFFMIAMTLQLNNTLVRSYSEEVERFRHLKASGVAPTLVQLAVTIITMAATRIVYLAPVSVGIIVVLNSEAGLILGVLLGAMSWAHITITYLVVLFIRTTRYASAVSSAIDTAMLFFCGFLVNTARPPASTFASCSLARYAYGATVRHMLMHQNYTCDGVNGTSYCYTSHGYLELEGFTGDDANSAAVSLAFFGAAATAVAFLRMWWL
jgi:ABC-type multidrug transport system ATPase subunit